MNKQTILELISLALANENQEVQQNNIPFKIGKSYFIRTVTFHLTGKVKEIIGDFLVLEEAAWIAWSKRFMDTIDKGELDEVEPVFKSIKGDTYVNIKAIIDAFDWKHALPRLQQ